MCDKRDVIVDLDPAISVLAGAFENAAVIGIGSNHTTVHEQNLFFFIKYNSKKTCTQNSNKGAI